jgi:spore maturation protein CgeB
MTNNLKIILISAFKSNPYDSGLYIKKTLESMSHNVIHLDFRTDGGTINEQIKQQENVDLLLAWKGSSLNPSVIKDLKYPTVLWYPDDIWTAHGEKDINNIGSSFDFVYTPIEENINDYKELGINAQFLPPGVDIDIFVDKSIKEDDKIFDFSHVGSFHGNRLEMLRDLSNGLSTGNPIDKHNLYLDTIYGKKYINIINNTKVNINIGWNNRGSQLRILEVLSCGGFLVTDRTKFVEQNFNDSVMTFGDEQFVDTCLYSIRDIDSDTRRKRASIGKELVHKYHTWENRMDKIFRDCL